MANFGGVYFLHFFSKMLIYWAGAKSSLKLWRHPTIATSIFEKNPFSNFFSGHIFWPKNACKHQNLKIFWYSVHPNAHICWCMWPGDLLEIWCHEGDSVGTKLCSSISGGWRLFQPFFLGKLVMGSSNGGIPIKIFKFWDAPNFGLFNEFKNTLQ